MLSEEVIPAGDEIAKLLQICIVDSQADLFVLNVSNVAGFSARDDVMPCSVLDPKACDVDAAAVVVVGSPRIDVFLED